MSPSHDMAYYHIRQLAPMSTQNWFSKLKTPFSSLNCICNAALESIYILFCNVIYIYIYQWSGIAQSVSRLATGWTVGGSNPVEGRDFPHLSRPALEPTQPPVQWIRVFPGGKEWPGRDVDPSPPATAVVKKEQSYTSTPPVGRTACTEP